MDIAGIVFLLILVEIGRRRGLLPSASLLLAFFPLRTLSYRLAYFLHDPLASYFKGILDFKLRWTESAFRGLASSQAGHYEEGIRLLTYHPQIRASVPGGWFDGMDSVFLHSLNGMDRLSELNLLQVEALWILAILLVVVMAGVFRLTRKWKVDRAGRLGGALVLSLVGLLLMYQVLLAVAPSVWLVPDSSISQWVEGSRFIKILFEENPLLWI